MHKLLYIHANKYVIRVHVHGQLFSYNHCNFFQFQLQRIIDGYRKAGYTFETLDVNSPKIQHVKQPELK